MATKTSKTLNVNIIYYKNVYNVLYFSFALKISGVFNNNADIMYFYLWKIVSSQ